MIRLLMCAALLAGCSPVPSEEWKCVAGLTYRMTNGAWVQMDGHMWVGYRDGPIKCDSTSDRGAAK